MKRLLLLALVAWHSVALPQEETDVFDKIPALKPLHMLGVSDPRKVVKFLTSDMGLQATKMANEVLATALRATNAGTPTHHIPAITLPPQVDEVIQKNQEKWFEAMGDSSLPSAWKKAIVPGAQVLPQSHASSDLADAQPFKPPSHQTLETIRKTVGIYNVGARVINLVLTVFLAILVAKTASFRPTGTTAKQWNEMPGIQRFSERVSELVPAFFPAFLMLVMAKVQLESASDTVQTFFTDPKAENRDDTIFPLGGQFFIE
eukprot:c47946_g1_i1.p1 GENE.c47946_g1_i1~~c47946_g1_i1.p1  ORF type:complete len:274 (+),score=57.42 c47946_g1_i1:42-824(+)